MEEMDRIMKLGRVSYGIARKTDNFMQMSDLLWGTDSEIYPLWRPEKDEFVALMQPLMFERGFIFYYKNIRVARMNGEIIGMLATLNSRGMWLDYDYSELAEHDERSRRVVEEYIQPLVKQQRALPKDTILGVAFCVREDVRQAGVGQKLFCSMLRQAIRQGYRYIVFDCLKHNTPARNFYAKMGCEVIRSGEGFGKDPDKRPEIVTLARHIL